MRRRSAARRSSSANGSTVSIATAASASPTAWPTRGRASFSTRFENTASATSTWTAATIRRTTWASTRSRDSWKDIGACPRLPTLRNVAVRALYMHDGSVRDLDAVLDHYAAGGRTISSGPYAGVGRLNPHKDLVIHGFTLTKRERVDLIAFAGRSRTNRS